MRVPYRWRNRSNEAAGRFQVATNWSARGCAALVAGHS